MISKFALPALVLAYMTTSISEAQPKANYDETKIGQYTLPDPLRMENGEPVKDAKMWREKRRLEILHLFETHVYGRSPGKPANLSLKKRRKIRTRWEV